MNKGGSLLEILGIQPVGPAGALERALVFENEVWGDFFQDWVTNCTFLDGPRRTTRESGTICDRA